MAREGPVGRHEQLTYPRQARSHPALPLRHLAASTWRLTANRERGIPHSPSHQTVRAPAHRPTGLMPAARMRLAKGEV
eukprot:1243793-Lingulodinium_polyedra.AAC.1